MAYKLRTSSLKLTVTLTRTLNLTLLALLTLRITVKQAVCKPSTCSVYTCIRSLQQISEVASSMQFDTIYMCTHT